MVKKSEIRLWDKIVFNLQVFITNKAVQTEPKMLKYFGKT